MEIISGLWQNISEFGAVIQTVPDNFGLLVSGVAFGCITGVFGIGAGWLVVPFLTVFYHLDFTRAAAISSGYICGTAFARIIYNHKKGAMKAFLSSINLSTAILVLCMMAGGWPGKKLNSVILKQFAETTSDASVRNATLLHSSLLIFLLLMMFLVFICIITCSSENKSHLSQRILIQAYHRFAEWCGFSRFDLEKHLIWMPQLTELHPLDEVTEQKKHHISIAISAGIIGFLAGMWGIGGGLLLYPILLLLLGQKHPKAAATTSVLVFINAACRSIDHSLIGNMHLESVVPLVIGGCIGIVLSTLFTRFVISTNKRVLTVYAVLLLIATGLTCWKILKLPEKPSQPQPEVTAAVSLDRTSMPPSIEGSEKTAIALPIHERAGSFLNNRAR